MKIKKIIIKSRQEFDHESIEFAKRLDKGEKVKALKGHFFESLEAVRNVLTEKRLEHWRVIRDRKPHSITELARWVNRDFKSVHEDISILIEADLVELRSPKGAKTRARKPFSIADQLIFKVA